MTSGHRRHRGFTLVELMVGLTAGLLLLAALSYFFLGGRQLGRTHGDVSRMQESGRGALEILGRPIRQAGARANPQVAFAVAAVTPAEGSAGAPDGITLRYDVQDGGEASCVGTMVPTGVITYIFAVDTTAHALTCTDGTGAAPVVVMDNIDNMQIRYGVDSNGDGAIESYQTGTGLTPGQVTAVRVSLLVRGPTANITATKTQTYAYNGATITATDGILRQVYTSTFTVRNQAK